MSNGSISGIVFSDPTGNGVYAPSDKGLPGFTIKLYDSPQSGPSVPKATLVSDAQGKFDFTNLAPDRYYVYVTNEPTKYKPTGKSTTYYDITLAQGGSYPGAYFGQQPLAPTPTPPTPTPIPPTPTPVPPGVRVIHPNEDLIAIVSAGGNFMLVPGSTYTPRPVQLNTKAPFTLNITGAMVDWTVPPATATACFRMGSPNQHVTGAGTWKTNAILAELLAASCSLSSLTLLDGAVQLAKIDLFGGASGAGAIVTGCTIGVTASCSVFSTQPCNITNNHFAASIGEVPLRIDCDSRGKSPDDVIISGNSIHSISGTNQKGACELRQLGSGCKFSGNTLYDYLRVGQGSANAQDEFAKGLMITGNNWPVLPPTIQLHLLLMSGITVTVSDNNFMVDSIMETAQFGAMSNIMFVPNVRHPSGPSVTPRPMPWNPINVPSNTTVTNKDGSGNTVAKFGG